MISPMISLAGVLRSSQRLEGSRAGAEGEGRRHFAVGIGCLDR